MCEENLPEELVKGLRNLVNDYGLINFEAALIGAGIGMFALTTPKGKVLRDGDEFEFTPENGWEEPVVDKYGIVHYTSTGGALKPKRKLIVKHLNGDTQEHEFEANKTIKLIAGKVFIFPK